MTGLRSYLIALFCFLCSAEASGRNVLDSVELRHGIAFFHELKYPEDFSHFDYVNPDAPKGGKLVQPTQINFNTLAPLQEGGSNPPSGGIGFTTETLLIRAGDEFSAFYGRLADRIGVTDDRMALVFRINSKATWNDGVPITAEDVIYTYKVMGEILTRGAYTNFIDSIEALDERHLVFNLTEPLNVFNIIMIQYTPILPAHYWRERDPTASTKEIPVTSGPYQLKEIKLGRYVEYERVPNYWGKDIPVNRGRYNFDVMRHEVYRDATVIREAFRKGLIDLWTEQDVRYWHGSYDIPALEKGLIKKIRRQYGIEVGVRRGIALNNRLDKLSDRRVRQALTLAMDFEWQNRTLHHGYHKRAQSFWPDTPLSAEGVPSEAELGLLEPFREEIPSEVFDRPFRFDEIDSVKELRVSMEKAHRLLRLAGWVVVNGKLTNSEGEIFEMRFLTDNPEDSRILLPYFRQLNQLGISTSLRVAESSQYINRLRTFDFDAVMRNQDILLPPVQELNSTYHSKAALAPDTRNVAGISDPVVDFLVSKAVKAKTLPELVASCRALDRLLLWQYYQIPLYAVDLRRTVHWNKFGAPDYEPKYLPPFPDGWWYDPSKAARVLDGD
ncbi:MAG: ABC transporter substrate-binding protein [Gammaproteobacteria bacterium TMED1]|nr:MAG: ABC transporter substrate-binding protein [Gammaproteobacteria bacterium TMED1]